MSEAQSAPNNTANHAAGSERFLVGAATDIGRKRSQNQDSIASRPDLGLFVVADGMGGHRGGETASAMVVDIIPKIVAEVESKGDWKPRQLLIEAIRKANDSIHQRSTMDPALQGMGTTCVSLLFKGNQLTVGHVGDSRCYYMRGNSIWQITRDHSLVQEKLRAGIITRDEVKTDRMKNVITRSVGFEPDVNIEIYEMEVRAGDRFLLCSDGLSGLIDDDKMLEVLERNAKDLSTTVRELIAAANSNGGDDNISTIVVEVL